MYNIFKYKLVNQIIGQSSNTEDKIAFNPPEISFLIQILKTIEDTDLKEYDFNSKTYKKIQDIIAGKQALYINHRSNGVVIEEFNSKLEKVSIKEYKNFS
uniref:Uncharacterized protein n=1 Tax=Meloidogyne hapla TaxID=6305 RepID=A0A1I8BUD3_MELHA